MEIITLSQGSGGKATNELIEKLFLKYFHNEYLLQRNDSAVLPKINGKIAMSTDSFVVNPIFFQGGDIGKLAICGTVNDIAMSGAKPLYISIGFIIEEGLLLSDLEKIVVSISETAKKANVKIVTGDTKVVEKGSVDKIYINTSGIGVIENESMNIGGGMVKDGDTIIVSGTLGDHGMCIMNNRNHLGLNSNIKSDCGLLHNMINDILKASSKVRVLRDPTRGGVATVLNEICSHSNISMELYEDKIPVKKEVSAMCSILGMDPLYVANEGKLIVIVDESDANKVLNVMRNSDMGRDSMIIGKAIKDKYNRVFIKTSIGGKRILSMPDGELLVRIC